MLCLSRLSILLSKHIHTFLPITFLIFNGFSIPINTIYVDTVDTRQGSLMHSMLSMSTLDTKHIHTFLPITFLIFNGFSIRKKFWKAETQGFSTAYFPYHNFCVLAYFAIWNIFVEYFCGIFILEYFLLNSSIA